MTTEKPVFLWDKKILECMKCKTRESGISARTRRVRHPSDNHRRYYAACMECGGGMAPIPEIMSDKFS